MVVSLFIDCMQYSEVTATHLNVHCLKLNYVIYYNKIGIHGNESFLAKCVFSGHTHLFQLTAFKSNLFKFVIKKSESNKCGANGKFLLQSLLFI
jgi:hypothetical protein